MAEVLGTYLYGSAVAGGLRPDSDVDLLVVIRRCLTSAERRRLVEGLMPISGRSTRPPGWRPVEVTVIVLADVQPWRYPPRIDLQYGEWKGDEFDRGSGMESTVSPDLTVALTSARETARTLRGPRLAELIDAIPPTDLRRAVLDELPGLLENLPTDTRNVLLTLARIWVTVATGRIVPKDVAAAWVAERVEPEVSEPIVRARDLYIHGGFGSWKDEQAIDRAVEAMLGGIEELQAG
jgi:aminoglycoside 9-adenylyltransferase